MHRLMPFLWISLGAVLGANTRFLVNRLAVHWWGPGFPWGTLIVNVAGCLAAGVVGTMLAGRWIDRPEVVRLVLMVGFLGSLTTFSAFAFETQALLTDGAWVRATAYVALSVGAGVAGVRLGVLLTPSLAGVL